MVKNSFWLTEAVSDGEINCRCRRPNKRPSNEATWQKAHQAINLELRREFVNEVVMKTSWSELLQISRLFSGGCATHHKNGLTQKLVYTI